MPLANGMLKGPLDIALAAIVALSVATILLAQEDSLVRDAVCARLDVCPAWSHAKAWQKILYDIAVGSLISLIFYALVVRLPDYQKRQRMKKSFANHYKTFREDCIADMLMVADETFEWGFHETLLEQDKFRNYFTQKISPSQDRWHAFQNNLDEYYLQSLITKMEILRDEITFILNNTDIPNDKPFEFLKRLSGAIFSVKNTTLEYDSSKNFARFLWSVFAGYDVVSGYRERDIIEEMIEDI